MLYTSNLKLKKPGDNDTTDQVPFNENADILDLEIKKIIDSIGDLSTLTTTDKTSLVKALNEIKSSLSKIDLSAAKVKLEDLSNLFIATEVESALKEVMTKINNLKLEDTAITVKDANNNFAGTKLNEVLDELFINADNIKKKVAGAIGSPLTATDTAEQFESKILTLENTFKSNLNSKGVTTTTADKMSTLIGKTNDIAVKKYAIGIHDKSSYGVPYYPNDLLRVTIPTNLNFTPSVIYMRIGIMKINSTSTSHIYNATINSNINKTEGSALYLNDTDRGWIAFRAWIENVKSDSFELVLKNGSASTFIISSPFTWEAYN